MVYASGNSETKSLTSDLDDFCDSLKLLLEKKQAGNGSELINDEIIAILDKLLQYKCISKKQHKKLLIKCNLLHE